MDNWFMNKNEYKEKLENSIMSELEFLIDETNNKTANYWLDSAHNIFAFINDNGDGDKWIEIHYELYDCDDEIIGDLTVLSTDEINKKELLEEVKTIVNMYVGD